MLLECHQTAAASLSRHAICRWNLDMWACGLILPCSGVCRSDIVIMYSNRGTFQALCWLLIGLQCNDCVILMTQIQLIVIFMRCEDCLFSLGLHGAEVYQCVRTWMMESVRWCGRRRGRRKQRLITVYGSSLIYPFVFLKSSSGAGSLSDVPRMLLI